MTTLRLGTESDFEAAVAVWRESDMARRGGPPPPGIEETVRSRLGVAGTWLSVAEVGDRVVGVTFAQAARADDGAGEEVPGLCHLSMVFVLPDHWGHGVGRLLVDATLEQAVARGYRRIQLWTHEGNGRSQRLYRGRGFRREGRVKDADYGGGRIGLWVRDLDDVRSAAPAPGRS
ncbi:MAG: GNAT family N-acetyltransferase [Actinomycetes bacterium]